MTSGEVLGVGKMGVGGIVLISVPLLRFVSVSVSRLLLRTTFAGSNIASFSCRIIVILKSVYCSSPASYT